MSEHATVRFLLTTPDGANAGDEVRDIYGPTAGDIEASIDFLAGPAGFPAMGYTVDDIQYVNRTYGDWCLHCGSDTCGHVAKHNEVYGR